MILTDSREQDQAINTFSIAPTVSGELTKSFKRFLQTQEKGLSQTLLKQCYTGYYGYTTYIK